MQINTYDIAKMYHQELVNPYSLVNTIAGVAIPPEFSSKASDLLSAAKEQHAKYLATQRSQGRSEADNPLITEWEKLPENIRKFNETTALYNLKVLVFFGLTGKKLASMNEDEENALIATAVVPVHDNFCLSKFNDGWNYDPTRDQEKLLREDLLPLSVLLVINPKAASWDEAVIKGLIDDLRK